MCCVCCVCVCVLCVLCVLCVFCCACACVCLYTLMMHGTPTCELLAIPPCQTRWTDTAARVSVTGGVVEAVVVSTGGKEGWGGGRQTLLLLKLAKHKKCWKVTLNLDNNYMCSLTCLTPLSSETIGAVASAREATTTILTLRVACKEARQR